LGCEKIFKKEGGGEKKFKESECETEAIKKNGTQRRR
jgi:hypothetical protein